MFSRITARYPSILSGEASIQRSVAQHLMELLRVRFHRYIKQSIYRLNLVNENMMRQDARHNPHFPQRKSSYTQVVSEGKMTKEHCYHCSVPRKSGTNSQNTFVLFRHLFNFSCRTPDIRGAVILDQQMKCSFAISEVVKVPTSSCPEDFFFGSKI